MDRRIVAALLGLALLGAGCDAAVEPETPPITVPPPTVPATPGGERIELIVFGAASLRDVLAAAKGVYESDHPGVSLTIATDSSAALRTQIEQGAAVEVFLAADTANPQRLVEAGLADGDAEAFASNALALVVPATNPAAIESPADLARPGVRIVAAGAEVPITLYATEVVRNLGGLSGYPVDFETAYAANVVSREDNVRAVLTKIELGEADAGLVYVTDAVRSDAIRVVPLPPGVNVAAVYAAVVLRDARQHAEARRFFDWMVGPDGQAVLAGFGFGPPP
jgi:molybdate transport system substrate-binding protein